MTTKQVMKTSNSWQAGTLKYTAEEDVCMYMYLCVSSWMISKSVQLIWRNYYLFPCRQWRDRFRHWRHQGEERREIPFPLPEGVKQSSSRHRQPHWCMLRDGPGSSPDTSKWNALLCLGSDRQSVRSDWEWRLPLHIRVNINIADKNCYTHTPGNCVFNMFNGSMLLHPHWNNIF